MDRRRFLEGSATWAAAAAGLGRARAADPAPAATPEALSVELKAAPRPDAPGRLSYDASPNGPVIRLRPGTPLKLRLRNGDDVPTSLQWTGLRGPSGIDPPLDAGQALGPGA